MNINSISDNGFTLNPINEKPKTEKTSDINKSFSDILKQAVETDAADKAENMGLLTGDTENLHNTMISAEKADLALLLAVQIRNKVIDAYSEIMRMQF